ncbi:DNA helicase [Elysia marginata]|uniref:DNA helicase n=1 Tax=Elysia marginata TaxID=1093978 RepID=A0AAV4ESU9_9GAST|nr:DNA helicase [Elysia marginata]
MEVYAKIEYGCLQYLRHQQGKLRADSYGKLRDAISHQDNTDPRNLGQRIILPSSYTGGPRYMFEKQNDAMCYVRKYGRPDLFITMATNPKWPEIVYNLVDNQQSHDRSDLRPSQMFVQFIPCLLQPNKDRSKFSFFP